MTITRKIRIFKIFFHALYWIKYGILIGYHEAEYGTIRYQAVIGSETSLTSSKPPSLTCSTSTTRLGLN